MRIDELIPYKSHPQIKSIQDILNSDKMSDSKYYAITNYLENSGFKLMGFGEFATVYEHPKYPWLFKFFRADPAYEYYLEYALKNQSNPNVVKIRGKFIRLQKSLCLVRLEKLEVLDQSHEIWKFIRAFQLYNANTKEKFSTQEALEIPAIQQGSKEYPGIWKVFTDLKPYPLKFRWDLGSKNIMQRDSIPVITDPLAMD